MLNTLLNTGLDLELFLFIVNSVIMSINQNGQSIYRLKRNK